MLTLSLPDPSNYVYARNHFAGINNLRRITELNRKNFRAYVDRTPFNLENQHILVGLLQQLSVDPSWDLDFLVQYIRFRANSLASTFKITSINRIGEQIENGFYRENVREHWCLIDNTKEYAMTDALTLGSLRPVVPLFSTVLERGYKHNVLKSKEVTKPVTDVAIIGIDLVELAIGWWLYMNQNREVNTGISGYLAQYPPVTAQLIHNQLTVVNILYEFFVKEKDLNQLISTATVTFTTLSEEKLFKEYLVSLTNSLTGKRLVDIGNMMSQLVSVYDENYFNYVPRGQNEVFSQTVWAWEPQVLKLYAIYLSIANRLKYKASDINVSIDRCLPAMLGRYKRIDGVHFRSVLLDLALEVKVLNELNSH